MIFDPKLLELLFNRFPDVLFSVANIGFLIQLRRMSVDSEKIKLLDQKILDLKAENESLKYQYTQAVNENTRLEGENATYRKFHEHPVVE